MTEIFRESATADGNSSVFTWKALRAEKGNTGTLAVFGTFDSGTASLQASFDGGTTFGAVDDLGGTAVALTANGAISFLINSDQENPVKLRVNLAGATSPSLTYVVNDSR